MRGIVNIVVDNGLILKLITVATYTINIENDLATSNIELSQSNGCLYTPPYKTAVKLILWRLFLILQL